MNQAVGNRVLFENRTDKRMFLARLARAVRDGLIEVHAFSILPTHFHLLVRSLLGLLSDVMQLIELPYAMYFNRVHDRPGHLVQGRFRSKPVLSDRYRYMLLRYLDWNAVVAGIVDIPSSYPFCSAWHYARPDGAIWLERGWVEERVRLATSTSEYCPSDYAATLGARPTPGQARLIEARIRGRAGSDDLDDIVGTAPEGLRKWFAEKALAADGMELGPPLVDVESIQQAFALVSESLVVSPRHKRRSGNTIVKVALLRTLARLSGAAIGRILDLSGSRVADAIDVHRDLVQSDPAYAAELARVAEAAIRRCHEPPTGESGASLRRMV